MNTQEKILSAKEVKEKLDDHRQDGKVIAFTNGCFDILHAGHVSYLEQAKKENRILIIGLNSDDSIQKIKGCNRPIIQQNHRARLLAALSCVDYVTIFDEETPYALISHLVPDVLIKGADWEGKEVSGADVVQAHGGQVEFIAFIDGCSTTQIIKTVLEKCAD